MQNGEPIHQIRLADWVNKKGQLPHVKFRESGWLLVRAVNDVTQTYRFATTGPYYVEIGERPRISHGGSEFFLEWLIERTDNLKIENKKEREVVLKYHRQAHDFWQNLVDTANAK